MHMKFAIIGVMIRVEWLRRGKKIEEEGRGEERKGEDRRGRERRGREKIEEEGRG